MFYNIMFLFYWGSGMSVKMFRFSFIIHKTNSYLLNLIRHFSLVDFHLLVACILWIPVSTHRLGAFH